MSVVDIISVWWDFDLQKKKTKLQDSIMLQVEPFWVFKPIIWCITRRSEKAVSKGINLPPAVWTIIAVSGLFITLPFIDNLMEIFDL